MDIAYQVQTTYGKTLGIVDEEYNAIQVIVKHLEREDTSPWTEYEILAHEMEDGKSLAKAISEPRVLTLSLEVDDRIDAIRWRKLKANPEWGK